MLEKNTTYPVLDKGFIIYLDSMGTDSTIVEAARVSYQKGTKKKSSDEKLLRYLIQHNHGSPLEMVDFLVQIKAPILVARQAFRHRISSMNEMSLRYSEAPEEFYRPEAWRLQDSKNRQSSVGVLTNPEDVAECYAGLEVAQDAAVRAYKDMLQRGVAREMARMVLPVNLYTTWYWKINLRSLANFIKLRDADGAQYEIREYAKIMKSIVKEVTPVAYEALEEYVWSKSGTN